MLNKKENSSAIKIVQSLSQTKTNYFNRAISSDSIYPCPQLHLQLSQRRRVAYYQNHRCCGDDVLSGGENDREGGREGVNG